MKVLIVDTVPKERATYLEYYINICERLKINYDRLIWDRSKNGKIEYKGHEIIYHGKGYDGNVSKIKKIYPLYKYRCILKKIIQNGEYTHLILVNTIAPVIIAGVIRKHFKNRYIMDIRDYTYEKWSFYKKRVDRLINDSTFSVISSRGFYKFLKPNSKIIIAHNVSNIADEFKTATLHKNKCNTIGFVGYVRYKKENIQLIENFLNSNLYQLLYAGGSTEGCNLEEFCEKNQIDNVRFIGQFENKDKAQIYKKIDIINSLYGDFSLEVTTAIPNRYYDALLFKKPIIASKNTFLGELVEKKHLGIAVDVFNDDIKKIMEKYIDNFNKEKFEKYCEKELQNVLFEQKIYEDKIIKFLMMG